MAFAFLEPGPLEDGRLRLWLNEKVPGDPDRNWAPTYKFDMRVEGSDEAIGVIDLRIGNQASLEIYGGHIGYTVDEEHRGQRFAARSVRLLLPLALQHGLHTIWITCDPENIASRRTCELAGGTFVEIVDLPEDNDMYREGERQKCRYRFDLSAD